ncbi:MAG: M48 family metalloprotease [Methylophilaceae bacterium]|nr:M48 family metalloprotease [Methylophilaceae bacterium]
MTKRILLTLVLMLSCSAAYAFSLNLDKLTNIISKTQDLKPVETESEVDIGKGVAANLLGAAPLVNDEKLQSYVNRLGWWLVQHTERTDLVWHFGVLDTDSLNAFAAPGGYVFITRGLLLNMRNEAELAGVLAHEIAHVLRRHHLEAIQKGAKTSIMADLASMAVESSQYGNIASKAISTGTELYARGLDKNDEYEADRMGVVIAARAGYDPYGLPAVLQTLDAMNSQDAGLALMFKTHPTPVSRLQQLDSVMSGSLDQMPQQKLVADRFEKVVGEYARKK